MKTGCSSPAHTSSLSQNFDLYMLHTFSAGVLRHILDLLGALVCPVLKIYTAVNVVPTCSRWTSARLVGKGKRRLLIDPLAKWMLFWTQFCRQDQSWRLQCMGGNDVVSQQTYHDPQFYTIQTVIIATTIGLLHGSFQCLMQDPSFEFKFLMQCVMILGQELY